MYLCVSLQKKRKPHPPVIESVDKLGWVQREEINLKDFKKYPFKVRVLMWVLKHVADILYKSDIS